MAEAEDVVEGKKRGESFRLQYFPITLSIIQKAYKIFTLAPPSTSSTLQERTLEKGNVF